MTEFPKYAIIQVQAHRNPNTDVLLQQLWAGLVGDAVDLIPFVTGVGEVTRIVNTGRKVADKVGDVVDAAHDASKAIDNVHDATKHLDEVSVCFIAGTLVSTEDGQKPIENIQIGDLVWATDEKTGETALKEVVQLFRNETEEWIHVTVSGEKSPAPRSIRSMCLKRAGSVPLIFVQAISSSCSTVNML